MRIFLVLLAALVSCGNCLSAEEARFDNSKYPKRLKRAESFLGIHFDFHAREDCTEVGKNTTPEMVAAILDQVRPDYIQVDCKGHPGISSYPTKVGHPVPGFVGDPLRVWREVTAKQGVALFMHYSGVWDSEAVKRHPDWARINEKGKPDDRLTSVFGPYADRLLIPQLKELSGVYGVDGVWVDGECWATARDYCDAAVKMFREKTGIQNIPRKADEPHWQEWSEFHREAFRRYLRHYVDEVHRHSPNFQIASNWAFSDHMPEPVTIDVDFLSGDYSLQNSVNSARFSARCLANQGKPWDLMAWAFSGKHKEPGRSLKSVPQLKQEAAVVLAQGGGFQAYFTQKRDGSIREWQMRLMAEAAKFCRERQKLCHKAQVVPQVALLYSRASHYRQSSSLFTSGSPTVTSLKGVLQNLLESQNAVQIVSEHHLVGRMKDWPLIVLPECEYLEPAFRDELAAYAKAGGSLLLIGPKTAALFRQELDIELPGAPQTNVSYLAHDGWLSGTSGLKQTPKLGPRAQPFGLLYAQDDMRSASEPAACVTTVGAGKIAATFVNLGERYLSARTTVARDFLNALARQVFPKPLVEVKGSHSVDVSVMKKDGKLLVNLVNTAGPHADANHYVFDDIPPVGPLEITLRTSAKPKRIKLEPEGRPLKFTFRSGEVRLTVPSVAIHAIVAVE